jgi:hypothetical protein
VGKWVMHPLAGWHSRRDDHECEVDDRHPSHWTWPTDGSG